MRIRAFKRRQAIFLHNLEYLIPQLIDLSHVVLTHADERAGNGCAGGWMLSEKAHLGDGILALNPAGRAHRVLADQLRIDD